MLGRTRAFDISGGLQSYFPSNNIIWSSRASALCSLHIFRVWAMNVCFSLPLIIPFLQQCPLRSLFCFVLRFLLSALLFSLYCSSTAVQLSYTLMYFCDKSHHCGALSLFSERVPISLYNALKPGTLVIFGLNDCVSLNFQITEL